MAQVAPKLAAIGVSKTFGAGPLFKGLTMAIHATDRIGLIGDNGSGKSTLLKILAGQGLPDSGEVVRSQGISVGYLSQAPTFNEKTVYEVLAASLAQIRHIAQGGAQAADDSPPEQAQHDSEYLEGWAWKHRLERAAQLLDLGDLERPCSALSGGFAKRLALARLYLCEADVLLLDEPTNHLDIHSIAWLESWLSSLRAAVVVITHDRAFLDNIANTMVELRNGKVHHYTGNYSDYVLTRFEEEAQDRRLASRQYQVLKHELDWARRSPKARTTKNRARLERVGSLQQRLDEVPQNQRMKELTLGDSPRLGNEILTLKNVQIGRPGAPLLTEAFDWRLCAGERWGIVGPNGVGKTSLLRLIAQSQLPALGDVSVGKNTQVAYYDQHRTILDPAQTVAGILAPHGGDQVMVNKKYVHITNYLARFGFVADRHQQRVSQLSGGECSRLALAHFLLTPANLLLFDEPTNDLDLTTLGVLEQALCAFPGCILLVSHDRTFLDRTVQGVVGLLPMGSGRPAKVVFSRGSYSDFLIDHKTALRPPAPAAQRAKKKETMTQDSASKVLQKRPLAQWEQREVVNLEQQIDQAEQQVAAHQALLATAELWQNGSQAAHEVEQKCKLVELSLADLWARWEKLMAKQEGL